jgi:hypothetical protein
MFQKTPIKDTEEEFETGETEIEEEVVELEETDESESVDGTPPEAEDEEVEVTIPGEDPRPEDVEDERSPAPMWVRDLRKSSREKDKKIRELEGRIAAAGPTTPKVIALGKKPTLEDHDYDTDIYETALGNWFDQKRAHEAREGEANAQQAEAQRGWQAKLDGYGKLKADLKVKDFEEAEAQVQEKFNVTQQGIMLQGLDNPALVVYALGRSPKKAAELSAIKDPVKFAIAIGKLETTLKVTPRKAAPPPTRSIFGNGPVSGVADSTLTRLRTDAEKTGDYTKVVAYKRLKKK